ncbi:hypothetical protein [Haladaptatus sp. CMAA 1911]|uniref:hypothetical protein n=1 Tax=unclassified Haladaptatus TaxID=2622732 RepID=UPI0037549530
MSTEAYEVFVDQAINKEWKTQRKYQQQLVERLDPASEIRIRSGETNDLRMSIDGMISVNRTGKHKLILLDM